MLCHLKIMDWCQSLLFQYTCNTHQIYSKARHDQDPLPLHPVSPVLVLVSKVTQGAFPRDSRCWVSPLPTGLGVSWDSPRRGWLPATL